MALTRKMLREMGIDEENIEKIIGGHLETVDGIKDSAKDELKKVQDELDDLKKDDWKAKFEKEHSDFEAYKTTVSAKETKAAKEKLFRDILKESNIDEKHHNLIVKATSLEEYELENGAFKDAEAVKKVITTDYADYIPESKTTGTQTDNPPKGNGGSSSDLGSMSMEEYIAARSKNN